MTRKDDDMEDDDMEWAGLFTPLAGPVGADIPKDDKMQPIPGYDARKTNAPEPPEIDWDGLQDSISLGCRYCSYGHNGDWSVFSLDETGTGAYRTFFVTCNNCYARGPSAREPEQAVDAWNNGV